jgi:hypothetical protein
MVSGTHEGIGENKYYLPLEKVGTSIMAKFSMKSRRNNLWPFIFVDYSTHMLWPYFGKTKDDLVLAIKLFKKEVIDKSTYQWKNLQSDSEVIYTDGQVKRYLDNIGIQGQYSSPYRHDQNGLAERSIGQIYDLARTMMLESKAPPSMFEDAIRTACTVLNKSRVVTGETKTPYELFNKEKPNYRDAVKFYQEGYSHIAAEQRKGKGKLTPKAELVRFIGYPANYKNAYLVYNPKTHEAYIRHDVK